MKHLTPQEIEALADCDKAIANARTKLTELSEKWRIYKSELTKLELLINEQKTNLSILHQRAFEIDPHHGLEPKGESDGL